MSLLPTSTGDAVKGHDPATNSGDCAAEGQEATLLELQSEGRQRMLAAEGCESFDILQDQADPRSSAFLQTWSSSEAHDAAFGELIMASGHLEKVLAALDEGVVQPFYDVVS